MAKRQGCTNSLITAEAHSWQAHANLNSLWLNKSNYEINIFLEYNMNNTPNNNIPKKIRLHIIIECDANPEDDNEWIVAEVTDQTTQLTSNLSFNNECWLDDVEEIL